MSGMDQREDNQKPILARSAEDAGLNLHADADAEFEQALKNFKSSIHAWSDAAYNRPRGLAHEVKRRSWRLAVSWALGCALLAGSASGVVYERRHQKEMARIAAAQRAAQQQAQLHEQQVRATESDDEVLFADIENDVSRQVPSALEPLAKMMDDAQ
jgi:hypothetical protein